MSDLHDDWRRHLTEPAAHQAWRDLAAWLDKRDAEMRRRLTEIAGYGQELTPKDRQFLREQRIQP
jgi:hypothetical protein